MATGVETVLPTDLDRAQVQELERLLTDGGGCARLVSASGESHVIPEALCAVLARVVHELASGNSVTVAPGTAQLTTQEAAEVLGVSRPYLVRLLTEGKLPFAWVGTHRRVELNELMVYKHEQKQKRRAAMDELAALSLDADLEI
jgi:excisionase family DNA binding protein